MSCAGDEFQMSRGSGSSSGAAGTWSSTYSMTEGCALVSTARYTCLVRGILFVKEWVAWNSRNGSGSSLLREVPLAAANLPASFYCITCVPCGKELKRQGGRSLLVSQRPFSGLGCVCFSSKIFQGRSEGGEGID